MACAASKAAIRFRTLCLPIKGFGWDKSNTTPFGFLSLEQATTRFFLFKYNAALFRKENGKNETKESPKSISGKRSSIRSHTSPSSSL